MDQQRVRFYSALCNKILRLADVTEVFQAVKCDTDGEKPQEDITKLKYWAKKCHMMHYVRKWEVVQPKLCLHNRECGSESHNSGRISWTPHWQFSEIINSVCILFSRTNEILGIIRENIETKPETTIFLLWKTLMHWITWCNAFPCMSRKDIM